MADIQQVQRCACQAQLDSLSCRAAVHDVSAMCLSPPHSGWGPSPFEDAMPVGIDLTDRFNVTWPHMARLT